MGSGPHKISSVVCHARARYQTRRPLQMRKACCTIFLYNYHERRSPEGVSRTHAQGATVCRDDERRDHAYDMHAFGCAGVAFASCGHGLRARVRGRCQADDLDQGGREASDTPLGGLSALAWLSLRNGPSRLEPRSPNTRTHANNTREHVRTYSSRTRAVTRAGPRVAASTSNPEGEPRILPEHPNTTLNVSYR